MNLGVNVSFKFKDGSTFKWKDSGLDKIKKYLINRMGYSAEEVSIVSGGMSNIDKEREKNKFLSGKSSVLIGSASISTGVDLQDNASALFLCSFDWNPTDNEQIAGRIHRQGNRFEKIRIVYPMVRNSADPSIFQQLYEKTLRIKNIWDKNDKGNTLDLKDFDLNTLRKGIMDEPEDLAKYWEEEQIDEIETMEKLYNARLTNLDDAVVYKNILDRTTNLMKGMIVVLDAFKKYKDKKQAF
jgi:SNF2 family DNA or RNA helicase